MTNAELIEALRVPHDWTDVSDCMRYDEWMHAAADALEAADEKIAYWWQTYSAEIESKDGMR